MEEKKYLIITLRYWHKYDNVLFWGKNSNGYETDLSRVGLYTKEEARKKMSVGDCYISMDKLGITKEMMEFKSPNVVMVVNKTKEVCDYINRFEKILKNKNTMKWGF